MSTTEILMPELGESVHEGTVSRWLKQVGDSVEEDEPVVEIMTDKVNTELPAPAAGYLVKIIIPEGENVKVFEPMGLIGDSADAEADGGGNGAAKEKTEPADKEPKPEDKKEEPEKKEVEEKQPEPAAASAQAASTANGGRKWYTPVVRKIAKESGLSDSDLAAISGSGEGGRVTKKDVEAYLASGDKPAAKPAPALEPKPATPSEPRPDQEVVTLTGIRKAIAEAMVKAHEIPSVSTVTAVDVTSLVEFRKANKESFQQTHGVKLTYTPFFIKALTEALQQFPYLNSSLQADNKLVVNNAVHLGIAVALGDGSQGLVVPVLRDCHKKNLIEIAKDLEAIAKKARDGKLEMSDYKDGTFALTNPGTYGALFGTPMIPAGMSGILGTYAIQEQVVAKDGMFGIKPIMHLVLSYDHRVVDGMTAGAFLKAVRDKLEKFDFFK